jgi:hypothetical protein
MDPRIIPMLVRAAFIAYFTWNAGKSGMSGRTFVNNRERNPRFFQVR